jgi:hypothetical protein
MAISVNMFNSNNLAVNVNVNNGSSTFSIPAANTSTWQPGTPTTNPTFNQGPPTPGNFGIGANSVNLTPTGSTTPFIASMTFPAGVNWTSIQIYVFFQSYNSCAWIVLNNGQIVTQGTASSPSAFMQETTHGRDQQKK